MVVKASVNINTGQSAQRRNGKTFVSSRPFAYSLCLRSVTPRNERNSRAISRAAISIALTYICWKSWRKSERASASALCHLPSLSSFAFLCLAYWFLFSPSLFSMSSDFCSPRHPDKKHNLPWISYHILRMGKENGGLERCGSQDFVSICSKKGARKWGTRRGLYGGHTRTCRLNLTSFLHCTLRENGPCNRTVRSAVKILSE